MVKRKNIYNNLKFFGYKVQGIANDVFIQLPDSKTISQALIAYENKHLKGRKKTFKVFSINKSISDLFFIHASMDGVILSENRDFLHDHFFHVLPKLQSLNRGFKYFEDIKFKIYRIIVRFYCITRCAVDENSKLKPFRHLIDFIMAAITDEITTIEPHSLDKIKLNENTKQVNSPQNAQQEDKAQKIADAEMARVNKLKIDLVFKQVVISVLNADPWLKFARSRFDDIIFTPDTLPLLWGATHRAGSSYLKKLKLNKLSLDQIQSNATISPLPPK